MNATLTARQTSTGLSLHIVTLTTCHNRREFSLNALRDLHRQDLPDSDFTFSHVVVDDGSTDGTSTAIQAEFPDVELVTGSGNLFWAGGMRFGWEQSVRKKSFDYLFVYNDDIRLEPDALSILLEAAEFIELPCVVAGSFLSTDGRRTTYGGRSRSSSRHPLKFAELVEPNGTIQRADTLNMNGALISRSALDSVGFLSDFCVHSVADFEYGLKLRKAGGEVIVASRHIGYCDFNPASESLPQDAKTFSEGLQQLFDAKREPFKQRLRYYRAHAGWLWPVYWVTPYLTFIPRYLVSRLKRQNRGVDAF